LSLEQAEKAMLTITTVTNAKIDFTQFTKKIFLLIC
jgi:hypothetical protein